MSSAQAQAQDVSIYNMDCLAGMALLDNASVDMVLCDLPYGMTQNAWDSIIPLDRLWEQYRRVLKPAGVVALTASQPFASALVASNRAWFKYEWIWMKTQATGHLNAYKMPMRKHEQVLIFAPETPLYTPQLAPKDPRNIRPATRGSQSPNYGAFDPKAARNVPNDVSLPSTLLTFANVQHAIHPTQKPVALFEYLIRTYTHVGALVLDCCMGSGTTAIAAINSGREYIGFETDAAYHAASVARVREHLNAAKSGAA